MAAKSRLYDKTPADDAPAPKAADAAPASEAKTADKPKSKSGDGRKALHKTHEVERRDLHTSHRDEMRKMFDRHEKAWMALEAGDEDPPDEPAAAAAEEAVAVAATEGA